MIYNGSIIRTAYFHPPNQRITKPDEIESSVLKPKILSIFSELNEPSTNNNNHHQQIIKKKLTRQSPILIRRSRSTIENLPSYHQSSYTNDGSRNRLQLTAIPPRYTFRNKSSASHKQLLDYSKTISEGTTKQHIFDLKLSNFLQTSSVEKKEITHTRVLHGFSRSKSHLSKQCSSRHYQYQEQPEKSCVDLKQTYLLDLCISPSMMNNRNNEGEIFNKTNVKELIDEWEDPKSNVAVLFDEEESIISDGNNPSLTQINAEEYDHFPSSNLTSDQHHISSISSLSIDNSKSNNQRLPERKVSLRRYPLSMALPPVAEHVDDEEPNDEIC